MNKNRKSLIRKICVGLVGLAFFLAFSFPLFGSGKAEKEVITLNFWQPHTMETNIEHYNIAIEAFEKEHPNIKVEMTTIPWTDIFAKWMSSIEAGTPPDVSVASSAFSATLNHIGALMTLDDLVEEMGGEDEWFADHSKTLVQMSKSGGHFIAIPYIQNCSVLWYKEAALKEAGLKVPKTWDELRHACEVLTKGDHYGILVTGDYRSHITQHTFFSYMLANGSDFFDHETGELVFNSPETREAIEFYTSLFKYSPPDSFAYGVPEAEGAMATGKIDMFIYGSWLAQGLIEHAPEVFKTFKVAPVPRNKGRGSLMGHINLVAFKDSNHPKEAKMWIKQLLKPEHYKRFVLLDPASNLPVVRKVIEDPSFWEEEMVKKTKHILDVVIQELPYAWMFGIPSPYAGELEAEGIYGLAISKVFVDGKTPQEAMDETTEEILKIIGKK